MSRLTYKDKKNLMDFKRGVIDKLELPRCAVKKHWNTEHVSDLLTELEDEVKELEVEIIYHCTKSKDEIESAKQIQAEAIDVAAYAFFIWDNARQEIEELKEGSE